ncbi:MAG: endolytic transglycosylase MltG [Oscillospiraceae bacterium]|nr:endolytic transglycosylase MltG [Oscillospiraceae bacterium]
MEDKTGVFKPPEPRRDRREEDTLASIFARRTSPPPKNNPPTAPDKTTVLDKADFAEISDAASSLRGEKNIGFAVKTEPDELPETEIEEEDDGRPFRVKNSPMEMKARKRKKDRAREEQIRKLKAQQTGKTLAHVFGGILLVVFIVSVSVFLAYYIIQIAVDFTGITVDEFTVEVEIPPDAMTSEIAEILQSKNLISMPGFFTLYSQLFGHDDNYLSGMFMLDSSMTYSAIIRTLQSTASIRDTVMVTIPEGTTAEEIGRLLEENFVCFAEDFEYYYTNKHNRYEFEKRLPVSLLKLHQLEGYFFPETYEFFVVDALRDGKNIDAMNDRERETIANYARIAAFRILEHFDDMVTPEMYKSMNERGFTLNELITLASMVQAEAADPEDMRNVAAVFINRLNNGEDFPFLQSDPTGYYADNYIKPRTNQRNIDDYQYMIDAYNTYISIGLPPGPINNPGMDAIMAVLTAPRNSNYWYFCANIETGEVFFASTYAEHHENLVRVGSEMTEIR